MFCVILASVSSLGEQLEQCFPLGVDLVRDMEEQLWEMSLYGPENPGILQLEAALLSAGSFPNLLQGMFYMLPIYHEGKLFVR